MMDMTSKSERLRQARIAAGFSSSIEAAARLGVSASTLRAHENGQNDFNDQHAIKYARAFNVSPEYLLLGTVVSADAAVAPANAIIGKVISEPAVKIPLYGSAVGGDDGEFVLNGNHLDNITAPPMLSGVRGAYAVQIAGESMSPRYMDGEVAFVDPHKRVVRGDFVVAQIRHKNDGEVPYAYVKRLVKHTQTELVLEQFNPPKELRFPHEDVVSVHFIGWSGVAS